MICEECGFDDNSEDTTFYDRNCKACGALIKKRFQLRLVEENSIKLMILQAKVREMIRKQLFKSDGEKNAY